MDKSVKLLSKVKAEMVILRETIAHDSNAVMVQVAKNLLAENQAWLDHWKAQAEFTLKNN